MTSPPVKVGLLHPGTMGLTLGKAFAANGHTVICATEGRSNRTRNRAQTAGFEDVGSIQEMVYHADVIVSICDGRGVFAVFQKDTPQEDAQFPVAEEVMKAGFTGIYVDCNTILDDPSESRWERGMATYVEAAGADFVSAAIYGYPPSPGTLRHDRPDHPPRGPNVDSPDTNQDVRFLYMSGDKSQTIVDMLDPVVFPFIGEIAPEDAKDYKRRLIIDNAPPNPEMYSRIDKAWTDAYSG